MAELDLYLTENDELQVVTSALQLGCKLIPDLHYPAARYESLIALEDYKSFRVRTRQFFFFSEKYFRSPLEMRQIEKGGKTIYYIFPGSGGPLIHFVGGGLFDDAGSKFIRPGFLSYSSTYENTTKKTMEKPPPELTRTYNLLAKSVKELSTRIKPGIRVYWLGQSAKKAVQDGAKLVGYEKLSADQLLK